MAGLVVYFALYVATPMRDLAAFGSPSRGELVAQTLLLFEEVVAGWFGDPPQFALLGRLPVLLMAAAILAVAWLFGKTLLHALGLAARLTALEQHVFALGAGLQLLSLYTLAIGLAGWLSRSAMFLLSGVALLLTLTVAWRARGGSAPPHEPAEESCGQSWLGVRSLWLLAPFAVVVLLGGLLPPVEFDVREYHLQAPKEFYQQGRITFLPHNVYANMPLGAEMHALLAMVLLGNWWTGALVGKTVIALFAPLTSLLLLAAGRRWFSITAGTLAAVVYLSTPWIARVSNLGLIDAALGFYLFASLYAVWLWRKAAEVGEAIEVQRGLLLLAGWLAGAAVSCKYTGAVFVALPLAGWVLFMPRPFARRPALVFSLAVAASGGLWLAKNAALAGNPVYPLMVPVLGGETRTAEKYEQWRRAHHAEDYSLVTAAGDLADVAWRSDWLSPLVVPLAALSWLLPCRRRSVRWLWLYFGYVIAVWWLGTHRLDRFWIPALPVLALLAGAGATWTAAALWRRALYVALAVGLTSCFLLIAGPTGGYTEFFVGYDRLRVDPARVDPWHRYLNEHVPPGHRALLVGDAQVFDLAVPILYNTVFDSSQFEQIAQGRTPAEVHRALAERRISHVYVHWGEIARYRQPGNYGFTDFVQPAVFRTLVAEDVLAPLPPLPDHPGQMFRVLAEPAS